MLRVPSLLPIPHSDHWHTLDSTKLKCFSTCPRKYFYEYLLGWTPEGSNQHLIFGQAWHEALEHLYQSGLDPREIDNAMDKFLTIYRPEFPAATDGAYKGKTPDGAEYALLKYIERYYQDVRRYQVIQTEQGGIVPISEDRELVIKMDLVARDVETNEVVALEHKTGTRAGETWVSQWHTSIQIGAYLHGLNAAYRTNADAMIIVNGAFFYYRSGNSVPDFERVPCRRSGPQMLSWLNLVNGIVDRIEYELALLADCRDSDVYLKAFPMNPESCTLYMKTCPFHPICAYRPNPLTLVGDDAPLGFQYRWWDPLAEYKNTLEVQHTNPYIY